MDPLKQLRRDITEQTEWQIIERKMKWLKGFCSEDQQLHLFEWSQQNNIDSRIIEILKPENLNRYSISSVKKMEQELCQTNQEIERRFAEFDSLNKEKIKNKEIKERKEKEEREEKERQEKCRREQAETESIHRKFAIAFLIVTFTPISYYFFS